MILIYTSILLYIYISLYIYNLYIVIRNINVQMQAAYQNTSPWAKARVRGESGDDGRGREVCAWSAGQKTIGRRHGLVESMAGRS